MTDSLKYNTISSLVWKFIERGGNAIVQMAVQVVMARLLSPEQFGVLAVMLVFVNIGNVIVQSGLNTALVQDPDVTERDYSTVFWLSLGVSVVIYFGVFFSAPFISAAYGYDSLTWSLRVLCLILIVNSATSVQVAKVQRDLRMRKVFNATIAASLISAVLGICVAALGGELWALVIQQISYQVSMCAALAIQIDWHPHFLFDAKRAKTLFGFGWRLLVSGLLDTCYQSLADLLVGQRFSTMQLGLVSQGKKYPNAIGSMLDGAIQPVMLSAVAHVQNDKAKVKRLVRRALKTSTFLVVPAMTLFAVVAPTLVPLLLGVQWTEAVWFLQTYCVVYMLLPIHTTNLQALNGVGRSDLFLKLELIKKAYGIANVVFCVFVLHDVYCMVGSYIVTGVVSTIVNAWPNRRVIGYSYTEQVRDICPAFLLAAIAAVFAWSVTFLELPQVIALVIQIVVFCASYLGLSALFRVESMFYLVETFFEMIKSNH